LILLLGIAFLAGVVTAVSPCVLPVLPILFAGGASGGGRRRPLAIVAGVVVAFTASLLFVAWILRELGLPQDLLRDIAIALLFVAAGMLIFPPLGILVERPLARLSRRPAGDLGGGFLLGLSLGLVFVPCGGVIQGYIATQAASVGELGAKQVAVTLAYALGAAVPMLAIAYGGRSAASGLRFFRAHAQPVRVGLGVLIAASAVLIVFHVDRTLQTKIGDYTSSLQHAEKSCYAREQLGYRCVRESSQLADFGTAPDFRGISDWFNSEPLSLRGLRGKVVLVDFWTYSCINCLRTLPHLKSWWKDYRDKGLVIVGVHTPEFAFEAVPANVRAATKQLGVGWPVALDPQYETWNAYKNQYWPAEYLIDRQGHIRNQHFGEGEYDRTERLIRELLGRPGAAQAELADMTPRELVTPETYLGYGHRLERYLGSQPVPDAFVSYSSPSSLNQNGWAFSGRWRLGPEHSTAGTRAKLDLHFHAKDVFIVMGGSGRVGVSVDGRRLGTIRVRGISRLYPVIRTPHLLDAQLRLSFTPGISVYSFTFG
jgi:cytochrome c biogenesis protein CcdA/thiol-disulfide isomerase/thioredoxin